MSKKRLGRGLDALMGELPARDDGVESVGKAKPAENNLPIAFLSPAKDQPRKNFSKQAIAELAASIEKRGMVQPILVRSISGERDKYEIVAGERRWRAAQQVGLHEVPVIIRELSNSEAAEIALIENIQRVDLSPIEEADAYQKLIDKHGRSAKEIAGAVGKSRSHIANLLRLRDLPKEVKNHINEGALTMGHARALLGTKDPASLAKRVIAGGLSVRATEKLAGEDSDKKLLKHKKNKKENKPSKSTIKDADIRSFERMIEEALGLEVNLEHQGKSGGRLTIAYETLDQLDDICKRLSGLGV
jgi:ParB family transcriptional regulator, chromosome partitioning protein